MSISIPPRLRRTAVLAVALLPVAYLPSCAREAPALPSVAAATPVVPVQAAAAVYVCPMHPHITSPAPGRCPICGMDLVLKSPAAGDSTPAANAITVDAAVRQSLGIRTADVERADLQPRVRVPARVVADAGGELRLQSRVAGFIERLSVRNTGTRVEAGAVIAELYAPELVQAQEELLFSAEAALAAAERLRRMGIAERDIEAVRSAGRSARTLPLRAPASGIVTAIGVREGSSVEPADVLIEISARAGVRIEAQLFPQQLRQLGDTIDAHFTLPGDPDAHWRGRDPQRLTVVDPVTQTIGLRFRVDDAASLPLGSVLDAELHGATREAVLVVPAEAVIRERDGARVLRADADGVYAPVPVELGLRYGDRYEVRSGLDAGDRIVISGQFLLDGEAQLRSALPQLQAGAEAAAAGHRHD
jgi:Cu(I)/Ag(I) efflux system membrane fusion protein